MKTIVLNQPGEFIATDTARPVRAPHQALVRVHRIGVCGTDLHAFAGRQPFFHYPRILGHELAVEVLEIPENNRGLAAGDCCAVEPYLACGKCTACRQGKTNCCEALQTMGVHIDGGMRPLLCLPVELLYKSTQLSLDQLALVETLGIGAHAVDRASLEVGQSVLVFGAGPIGLSVVQFAMAAGAHVRVVDISPVRRAFVERFGVETLPEFDGQNAATVFDATGNRQSMEQAFQCVAHGGKIVFVGLVNSPITFDDPNFHRREITLLASRNSVGLFPKIIRMVEEGRIDTQPWITHRLALSQVPAEFPSLPRQPNLVKAIIETEPTDD